MMPQFILNYVKNDLAQHWINIFYVILVFVAALFGNFMLNVFYKRLEKNGTARKFPLKKVYLKLILWVLAIVLMLTGLPGVSNSLVQLIGVLLGAIIAFSSSTLIANFMSGVLMRFIEPYKPGDMVQIKTYFGKVYHIGFLHTEIQTPYREIVSIPNLVAISDIITNYTKGNYIVNVDVSIGYNTSRYLVEEHLLSALEKSGLKNPFVLVMDLGNYCVTYRANGLLDNSTNIMSARSHLRMNILDVFHQNGIQIMSPSYMNHKAIDPEAKTIPRHVDSTHLHHPKATKKPEKVMFETAHKVVEEKESEETEQKISDGFKNMISGDDE